MTFILIIILIMAIVQAITISEVIKQRIALIAIAELAKSLCDFLQTIGDKNEKTGS